MTDSHLPASKGTILVVDDDPELVTFLRMMLEDNEFNVRSAYSGPQLFASLEEQTPDLILLDIKMPQMDCLQMLKRLKGNHSTASIPVILLTTKVQFEDVLSRYKTGADYYLTKPFTNIQLLTSINLILSEPDNPLSPLRASA